MFVSAILLTIQTLSSTHRITYFNSDMRFLYDPDLDRSAVRRPSGDLICGTLCETVGCAWSAALIVSVLKIF